MIPLFKPNLDLVRCADALTSVLTSGQLAEGPRVQQFELELEKVLGVPVVTTNSGTSALHLAYDLAGVMLFSCVITTPMTCLATNLPLYHLGANIIWADVDENGLISTDSVKAIIESPLFGGQSVIVGVDYGGLCCDWEALRRIAASVDGVTISDSSHGLLNPPDADFVAYSFQAIKHLTTGDGGAVKVPSHLIEKAKRLRWFGLDRSRGGFRCEQSVSEAGYKFHMNDLAAAMGLANLPTAIAAVEWSRQNANFYLKELSGIDGLTLPRPRLDTNPSWWSFVLQVPDRPKFVEKMAELGVQCARIHSRNDTHPIFKNAITPFPLTGVQKFDEHQVSIPVGFHVSYQDREQIVDAVRKVAKCW